MIEKRLLQRWTPSTRWVAASRRSRWQRWADALLRRWGRAAEAAPVGIALLRGSRAAAPIVAARSRADVSVALAASFQLAWQRTTRLQPVLERLERHQLSLVRTLLRPPRVERRQGAVVPRVALPALVRVPERVLVKWFEARVERQIVERLGVQRVLVRPRQDVVRLSTARLARREGPSLDELSRRLQRRAERLSPQGPVDVPTRLASVRSAAAPIERASEVLPGPSARGLPARDRGRHELAAAAPVVNIERITEQVIQHLDRRVTAQRERMGRI